MTLVPPQNTDAEAMVLSALLLDPTLDTFDAVEPVLRAEHFYGGPNARVYAAVEALASEGQPVGLTTVATWLQDRKQLDAIGGVGFLSELVDAVPAVADSARNLASIVRDKWRLRQIIQTCQRVQAEAPPAMVTVPPGDSHAHAIGACLFDLDCRVLRQGIS